MNAYRAKPLNFPWPPFCYGLAVVIAIVLDRLSMIPLPQIGGSSAWLAGIVLTIGALLLYIWATKTLMDSATTVMCHRCSTHLVTRGPFRYTRNPIYLGYTLLTAALGLLTGNPWLLITALAVAAIMSAFVVRREEMHLLSRFGCEFEYYCRHTRRWI